MSFAHMVLAFWLPLSLLVFPLLRPAPAAAGLVVAGMLLLPERTAFHFQGLPEVEKQTLPALALLLACLVWRPARLRAARPGSGPELILVALALASVATVVANREPVLVTGQAWVPGLKLYDALSRSADYVLRYGIPFVMGRALFRTGRDLRALLGALAGAGLLYSIPTLFEVRMYPQLHHWLYGFYSVGFGEVQRFGGWRPSVLMTNGLALGVFTLVAALAASALWRSGGRVLRIHAGLLAPYLILVLVACRSLNALATGLVLLPLALLPQPRIQARAAALIAALVVLYPLSRALDVFPAEPVTAAVAEISEERAGSLRFRFESEHRLMDKVRSKPLLGWGGYDRNLVLTELGGRTIFDSFWIITITNWGAVAAVGLFALLLAPVAGAIRRLERVPAHDQPLLAGLVLIVLAYSTDLLANGLFTNTPYFLAGALSGLTRGLAPPRTRSR